MYQVPTAAGKPQRNTGPPTAGRLPEKEKHPFFAPSLLCSLSRRIAGRLPCPPWRIFSFFSSRKGAKTCLRKAGAKKFSSRPKQWTGRFIFFHPKARSPPTGGFAACPPRRKINYFFLEKTQRGIETKA